MFFSFVSHVYMCFFLFVSTSEINASLSDTRKKTTFLSLPSLHALTYVIGIIIIINNSGSAH